jgi:hypothetical protein
MLARRMATGALTTLWAACLSAPAHGSMVFTAQATVAGFMAVATTGGVTMAAGIMAADIPVVVVMATVPVADMRPAASEEVTVVSTEEVVSMAAEVPTVDLLDSTAVAVRTAGALTAAAGPMVAEATAVGTAKTSHLRH